MELRIIHILFILGFFFLAPAASAATISKAPNNLGLVSYWSFDEGAGTKAADHSGRGNTGSLQNTPTWTSGKLGGALSFNGSNQYVSAGSPSSPTGALTISAWVYKTANTAWASILDRYGSEALDCFSLGFDNSTGSKLMFMSNGTSPGWNAVLSNSAVPTGQWVHVAASSDGSTVTFYQNGVADGTKSTVAPCTTGSLRIGVNFPGGDEYFSGKIDELRLYSRALSATEISSLYQSGTAKVGRIENTGTLGQGLVGWWTLDGADVTDKVYDRSGQGNHGYIFSGAATSSMKTLGKLGQALLFGGGTQGVAVADAATLDSAAVTVAAWVFSAGADPSAVSERVVDKANSGTINQAGYRLQAFAAGSCGGTASWGMQWYNGAAQLVCGPSIAQYKNKWVHIVFTHDGTTGRIYANGTLVNSLSASYTTDSSFNLGLGNSLQVNRPIVGKLDDIRIYDRALSAAEVGQLYRQGNANLNASSQKQQGAGLANGLVGLWTFDGADITTAILDRSGNGFNGYLVGANNATSSRKTIGKVGQGFLFGGQNTGGINVGSSASLTPSRFTIAGWVKPSAPQTSVYNYVFSNTRDNCLTGLSGIELKLYSAGLLSGLICNAGTAISVSASPGFATSTWAHVAFTYDGANMRLYKNGALLATQANTTDPPAGSYNTYIGSMGHSAGSTYTLKGALDDIRLYDRALSAAEVGQLYLMGK